MLIGIFFALVALLGMEIRMNDVSKSLKTIKEFNRQAEYRIEDLEKELANLKETIVSGQELKKS